MASSSSRSSCGSPRPASPLIVGIVVFAVLVGPLGAPATAELALLSWLSGAAFILLVETSLDLTGAPADRRRRGDGPFDTARSPYHSPPCRLFGVGPGRVSVPARRQV